ncbi:MAG: hypothetical protein TQ37_09355 [Candidatus Synechococcus spongiarum 15L]|uniref:IS5/IS1182 family transposase n=2 Tax=Candidatus Synechococcus spongiarum TaxID=431041 RepID=A0A1T1C8K1_9SYNE|nr:MAG: hypothetical protein TQ37_09355 [Candidatus Synechococcus spongiarum 15L]OOV24930.1 hypothetical protein BV61_07295 [Candidatus Synechococcus spongiarum LMB bulk15M]
MLEWESKKRKRRREVFLDRMEELIPWEKLLEQIKPCSGGAGMEALLYEAESVRRFTGSNRGGRRTRPRS